MRKIGLCIQFENVNNYGTVLQAMATKRTIDAMGYDTSIIRYKRKYDIPFILHQIPRLFDSTRWKIYARRKKRRNDLKYHEQFRNHRKEANLAFNAFRHVFFPEEQVVTCYGYKNLQFESKLYDAVLVGSDQLWLPVGVRTNFYNLNFVLPGTKRISYATSFGVSSIPNHLKPVFADYLAKIDCLSVREESGLKIIKELTDRNAFLACDPVMLLSKDDWNEIINEVPMPESVDSNYVLSYFLGGNEKARNAARCIADCLGLQLVALSFVEDYFPCDEGFGDVAPIGVSPLQFVKLIKNATYVMTDSFHGTAFSIIFERQFLTTYRFSESSKLSKNSRIDSILKRFGILERLYIEGDPVSKIQDSINYTSVSKILDTWRIQSSDFLRDALEK